MVVWEWFVTLTKEDGMVGPERLPTTSISTGQLVVELERALVDYVEKYGPTNHARAALRSSSIWHSTQLHEPPSVDPSVSRPDK
jgi:hypothetical protein